MEYLQPYRSNTINIIIHNSFSLHLILILKIGAIYYECAASFDGQHMFKHSLKPNPSYEANAEAHIIACIAACEADGDNL